MSHFTIISLIWRLTVKKVSLPHLYDVTSKDKLTCRPESSAGLNSLLISTISIFCGACRWTQKIYVTISNYFHFLWKRKMEIPAARGRAYMNLVYMVEKLEWSNTNCRRRSNLRKKLTDTNAADAAKSVLQ